MGYPSVAEAQIFKSRSIQSQVRAAIELDYPVFSGAFSDTFPGATLDTDKWFVFQPSWGVITVAGGTVTLSVNTPSIAPPWLQSRHNLAFPLSRETDWQFDVRMRFPVVTGFGAFLRICGLSFRDAEAIFAVKANTTDGVNCHCPDGFYSDSIIWSTAGSGADWRRFRVSYDHIAQNYIVDIDQNDDGVYETRRTIAVNGRYADSIVIGNSTAIQGQLGDWTQVEVDSISVSGTVETVDDPWWAAPFVYDSTRFGWLPTMLGGRVSIDKRNAIDAAELQLDNFGLDEQMDEARQLYTWTRFLNRRAIIQGRAGDGNGSWTPWEILFDGLCAEKQPELQPGGRCLLTLPMRDRYRAIADDMEVLGAYSDAGTAIPGVGMNMTEAQIVADVLQDKCGLPASAMNILATPNNTPRNRNIFRKSGLAAVREIAESLAVAVYQRRSDARIEVQEWPWGSDSPGYHMSTAEEIRSLAWSESAFDATSAEQLSIENTDLGSGGFTATWPPSRVPFYGRLVHSNAISVQNSVDHDARPFTALKWWERNRNLGGITARAFAQFWLEHDLEIGVKDDKFLGFGRGESWIVDGWEHAWQGDQVAETTIRMINAHPDRFLRRNLRP